MGASPANDRARASRNHFRFHAPHAHLASAFGDSWFGTKAEAFARFFGTPTFLVAQTIIGTLSFFYSVLGVCLFVPVVAGLNFGRFGRTEAIAAISGGVIVMLALQLSTSGAGARGVTPAMAGLVASIVCAGATALFVRGRVADRESTEAK